MSEIHALSGAYAIDALDDIERAQFERHLADCADCRSEVASLREAASLLAETASAVPSDALRGRVLAGISTVRPLPPPAVEAPARRRPRFRPAALVAAAAAVIAVGAGAVAWEPWEDQTSQAPQLSAADRVLQAPDAERVTHEVGNGGEATVVASRSLNQVVVITKGLPALPEGKIYEMWIQDAEKGMVPAGLMDAADATVVLDGDIANAVGAGITVEPAGGSRIPTTEPVALFEFEKA